MMKDVAASPEPCRQTMQRVINRTRDAGRCYARMYGTVALQNKVIITLMVCVCAGMHFTYPLDRRRALAAEATLKPHESVAERQDMRSMPDGSESLADSFAESYASSNGSMVEERRRTGSGLRKSGRNEGSNA